MNAVCSRCERGLACPAATGRGWISGKARPKRKIRASCWGCLAGVRALGGDRPLEGIITTDTRAPQASFDAMVMAMSRHAFGEDHILAPQLLHITRRPRRPAGGPTA